MNTARILQCVVLVVGCALVKCEVSTNTTSVFTLDDFLNHTLVDNKWDGIWVDDEHFVYKRNDYYIFNVKTKTAKIFVSGSSLKGYPDAKLKIATNMQNILVKYNIRRVYRYSTIADYAVLRVDSGTVTRIDKFQYCELIPNSESAVAVQNNNILYFPNISNAANFINVTTDGIVGVVYNGIPDWVYEEEVISGDSTLWVSPSGKDLVYAKFVDTKVEEFTYYTYGNPGDLKDQYPTPHKLKYPKAGTPNPVFSLLAYNIISKTTTAIQLDFDSLTSDNFVLYDVTWTKNDTVLVTYTNRLQSISFLTACNITTGKCDELHRLEEYSGWLEPMAPLLMGDMIVERMDEQDFDVFRVIKTDLDFKLFTIGDRTVSKIHGFTNSTIYFEAAKSTSHSQQHIYSLDLNTENLTCLSCNFTVFGELCQYARADFSLNMSYMARICLGPGPSYVDIVDLKTNSFYQWEEVNNQDLRAKLKTKSMPIIKDLSVDINGTRFTAAVRLLLPPAFNENETTQYPMLVNVYGGPNSNQINDAYSINLAHFLVTSRNYIYAYIDGRGSGKRERSLTHAVYKKLGQFEIDDQITVTKWLRDTQHYIDGSKIGIWGWSYGGFATAWAISKDNHETFKCGVSVAPVTSFIYYDSIYTERYMRLPTANDNILGYNNTDLTRRAETFRNKTFLLVHGNADDNVHYQQSMLLARALELADIPFQQISYPDENHNLGGVRRHLYHSLDAFWQNNFQSDVLPTPSPLTGRAGNGVYQTVPIVFLISLVFGNVFII